MRGNPQAFGASQSWTGARLRGGRGEVSVELITLCSFIALGLVGGLVAFSGSTSFALGHVACRLVGQLSSAKPKGCGATDHTQRTADVASLGRRHDGHNLDPGRSGPASATRVPTRPVRQRSSRDGLTELDAERKRRRLKRFGWELSDAEVEAFTDTFLPKTSERFPVEDDNSYRVAYLDTSQPTTTDGLPKQRIPRNLRGEILRRVLGADPVAEAIGGVASALFGETDAGPGRPRLSGDQLTSSHFPARRLYLGGDVPNLNFYAKQAGTCEGSEMYCQTRVFPLEQSPVDPRVFLHPVTKHRVLILPADWESDVDGAADWPLQVDVTAAFPGLVAQARNGDGQALVPLRVESPDTGEDEPWLVTASGHEPVAPIVPSDADAEGGMRIENPSGDVWFQPEGGAVSAYLAAGERLVEHPDGTRVVYDEKGNIVRTLLPDRPATQGPGLSWMSADDPESGGSDDGPAGGDDDQQEDDDEGDREFREGRPPALARVREHQTGPADENDIVPVDIVPVFEDGSSATPLRVWRRVDTGAEYYRYEDAVAGTGRRASGHRWHLEGDRATLLDLRARTPEEQWALVQEAITRFRKLRPETYARTSAFVVPVVGVDADDDAVVAGVFGDRVWFARRSFDGKPIKAASAFLSPDKQRKGWASPAIAGGWRIVISRESGTWKATFIGGDGSDQTHTAVLSSDRLSVPFSGFPDIRLTRNAATDANERLAADIEDLRRAVANTRFGRAARRFFDGAAWFLGALDEALQDGRRDSDPRVDEPPKPPPEEDPNETRKWEYVGGEKVMRESYARELLGLDPSAPLSKDDIVKAFRTRIRYVHPDTAAHLSREEAEAQSKEVIAAWEVLKDSLR